MPITSITNLPRVASADAKAMADKPQSVVGSRLVIDCSRYTDSPDDGEQEACELTKIVSWVMAYPQRSHIQVYVDGGKGRPFSRRLQGRLQALGCRVTARHARSYAPAQ